MSGWLTTEGLTDLAASHLMGPQWGALVETQRANFNAYVGARWSALPWAEGKEPQRITIENEARTLDSKLMQAYAMHLRSLAQSNNPLVDSEAEEEASVLSDIPVVTKNILVGGGYLRIRRASEVLTPPKRPVAIATESGVTIPATGLAPSGTPGSGGITAEELFTRLINILRKGQNIAITTDNNAMTITIAGDIPDGSIGTSKLADDAVTEDKLARDSVGGDQIQADSVASGHIKDNAIDGSKIPNDAIQRRHIGANQIDNSLLAGEAVGTAEIQSNAVTEAKLTSGIRTKLNARATSIDQTARDAARDAAAAAATADGKAVAAGTTAGQANTKATQNANRITVLDERLTIVPHSGAFYGSEADVQGTYHLTIFSVPNVFPTATQVQISLAGQPVLKTAWDRTKAERTIAYTVNASLAERLVNNSLLTVGGYMEVEIELLNAANQSQKIETFDVPVVAKPAVEIPELTAANIGILTERFVSLSHGLFRFNTTRWQRVGPLNSNKLLITPGIPGDFLFVVQLHLDEGAVGPGHSPSYMEIKFRADQFQFFAKIRANTTDVPASTGSARYLNFGPISVDSDLDTEGNVLLAAEVNSSNELTGRLVAKWNGVSDNSYYDINVGYKAISKYAIPEFTS